MNARIPMQSTKREKKQIASSLMKSKHFSSKTAVRDSMQTSGGGFLETDA